MRYWTVISSAALASTGGVLGFCIAMMLFLPDADLRDALDIIGAGIGATLSVFGAFAVTYYQLHRQARANEQAREQALRAAKAILTSDLSHICGYLRSCATTLNQMAVAVARGGGRPPIPCPAFPQDALLRCERVVSLADETSANVIIDFMEAAQVQRARFEDQVAAYNDAGGRLSRMGSVNDLDLSLRSVIGLYALAENLFDYARRRTSVAKELVATRDGIRNTARILDLRSEILRPVVEEITEMYVRQGKVHL